LLLLTIANRVLGIGREIVIAQSFGTGKTLDIYLFALTIPAMLITLFIYSYPSAIVPIFFNMVKIMQAVLGGTFLIQVSGPYQLALVHY